MDGSFRGIRVEVIDETGPRTILMSPEDVVANPIMLAQAVGRIDKEIRECSSELVWLGSVADQRFWKTLPGALRTAWDCASEQHEARR